jgi:hypothetical protein
MDQRGCFCEGEWPAPWAATGIATFQVPGNRPTGSLRHHHDFDVHQFTSKNRIWTDTDLTATAGGAGGASLSQITACVTTPNNQFHMFYQPTFGQIYQNYFNGTSWLSEDLGGNTWGAGGMASFAIGNLQHGFYLGQ